MFGGCSTAVETLDCVGSVWWLLDRCRSVSKLSSSVCLAVFSGSVPKAVELFLYYRVMILVERADVNYGTFYVFAQM